MGNYQNRIRVIDFFSSFVKVEKNIFMTTDSPSAKSRFAVYNEALEKLRGLTDELTSKYNDPEYDLDMNLKVHDGKVYALQLYGPGFRVFEPSGDLIGKGIMKTTPFDNPDYQSTGAYYTFEAFDIFENHFVTIYVASGRFNFLIFDMEGNIVKRAAIPFSHPEISADDLLYVRDMDIVQRENQNFLFLMLFHPVGQVIKINFSQQFFLP